MIRALTRSLARFNRWLAKHAEITLQDYEIMVADEAYTRGTTISEQRERLGHLAPPHDFAPDRELRCSVCKSPLEAH